MSEIMVKSNSANDSKKVKDDKLESMINKRFICIMVTLAVAFVVAIACFIFLFVEVVNAMSELSSLRTEIQGNTLSINNSLKGSSLSVATVSSCAALPPSSPSGYYWVKNSIGSAVPVYCDMTRSCGNITGGWMRLAKLDMTDSSQQCPSGLRQRTYNNTRTCVNSFNFGSCIEVPLPTNNIKYSKVCGRVIAYQYGLTNGFESNSINSAYVDGIGLTYGSPREHIWTFAATISQTVSTVEGFHYCPCIDNSTENEPPDFVGDDYFCDSGQLLHIMGEQPQFFGADPLWDGAGCGSVNTCCDFNNPPWFYKQLPLSTIEDVQFRVCRSESNTNEDIAIQEFEIYVN